MVSFYHVIVNLWDLNYCAGILTVVNSPEPWASREGGSRDQNNNNNNTLSCTPWKRVGLKGTKLMLNKCIRQ